MAGYAARRRHGLALLLAIGLLATMPARARGAPDVRELEARQDYAAGRYQTALETFARLYAETLHPNYLRNIARCYQNLGEPDRAITSFRDYLRKAKSLSPEERAEIEGYIKEMEDLKRQREGGGASAKTTAGPRPTASPPPAVATGSTAPALMLTAPPPAAPRRETSPPIYERWWFWAVVAGAVGAGVGVAAATGAFTHYNDPPCPGGTPCH